MKPTADNILLKPSDAKETTASGIIVPKSAQKKTNDAEVIAMGPDCSVYKDLIKKGARVIFQEYTFDEIELDGIKYFIGPVKGVLGVFT